MKIIENSANSETCKGNQKTKPFRNIKTDENQIEIFNWKEYLNYSYKKANSKFKLFENHYYEFYKEKNNIFYKDDI